MPKIEELSIELNKVFSKNTAESYEWARDNAHNLKYDAVWDILPNTNSMDSII